MRNIWRVFARDWRRILAVPKAWIIVIGIIVTPALYAWVNVLAFWDPYGETGKLSVAVTNLDEGASSEITGTINVGDQVVEQLKKNDQLGWTFVGRSEAEERVKSGKSYAAIIIPKDFSENLLSITTAEFTQPKVEYYVNEKANAVAPKMTDVGANTLVTKITSEFTSTVAEAAADALSKASEDAQNKVDEAQEQTRQTLNDAAASLSEGQKSLTSLQQDLENARTSVAQAKKTLSDVDTALSESQAAISQSQTLATQVQQNIADLSSQLATSYADVTKILAQISSQSQGGMDSLTQVLKEANSHVNVAIDAISDVTQANGKAIDELQKITDQVQELVDSGAIDTDLQEKIDNAVNTALSALSDRNTADQELVEEFKGLDLDQASNDAMQAITDATKQIDTAVQGAASNADTLQDALLNRFPELNRQLAALSGSATGFSAAIDSQRTQIQQAQKLLDSVDTQLTSTSDAVGQMAENIASLNSGLSSIQTDMNTLSSASLWKQLKSISKLDAEQIAQFMASPVEVSEKALYPISLYGSAMAALFTNLSLWIGAFVLMVILKLEVDDDGVPGLTVRQAYMGRWSLLAVISASQGLLVTVGNLVLGVQTVNPVAFVVTGMVTGLSYLSIIYALSVALTHVGKGLCVVLVIMQIPGASGLYPIEMMPSFFRHLYPFFPFTYGIGAMRETIAGFYDGHYWRDMAVLGIFVVGSFILGLVLRSHLVNLNRLFNRQIAATDVLIAEETPHEDDYRLSQVLRSLSNRREYRRRLEQHAATFARYYPRLRRGGLIAGIIVPIVLAVIPSSDPSVKALLLGLWVAWFVLLFAYLIIIEYIRDAIDSGLELSALPDADLHQAMSTQRKGQWGAFLHVVRTDLRTGLSDALSTIANDVGPAAASSSASAAKSSQNAPGGKDGAPSQPEHLARPENSMQPEDHTRGAEPHIGAHAERGETE